MVAPVGAPPLETAALGRKRRTRMVSGVPAMGTSPPRARRVVGMPYTSSTAASVVSTTESSASRALSTKFAVCPSSIASRSSTW